MLGAGTLNLPKVDWAPWPRPAAASSGGAAPSLPTSPREGLGALTHFALNDRGRMP